MLKIADDKVTENLPITNLVAETQEEYKTLPGNIQYGVVAFAFELSEDDIKDILESKRIYVSLITGVGGMQPINVNVNEEKFEADIKLNHSWMGEHGFQQDNSFIMTDKAREKAQQEYDALSPEEKAEFEQYDSEDEDKDELDSKQ